MAKRGRKPEGTCNYHGYSSRMCVRDYSSRGYHYVYTYPRPKKSDEGLIDCIKDLVKITKELIDLFK